MPLYSYTPPIAQTGGFFGPLKGAAAPLKGAVAPAAKAAETGAKGAVDAALPKETEDALKTLSDVSKMGPKSSRTFDPIKTKQTYEVGQPNSIPRTIIFPSELSTLNRPIFELRCLEDHSVIKAGTSVYLPAPEGLAYANKAEYGESSVGIIGSSIMGSAASLSNSSGLFDGIKDLYEKGKTQFQSLESSSLKAALLFGADKLESLNKGAANAVRISAGVIYNPFVMTSFDGTGTRSYSFEYEFIPSSASEAQTIKHLTRLFQISVYGQAESLVLLKYPPRWNLAILNQVGVSNKELKPLSAFYECYLESCDVAYNETNNSFFQDNNPVSTKISLTFKETKALHADQIAELLVN